LKQATHSSYACSGVAAWARPRYQPYTDLCRASFRIEAVNWPDESGCPSSWLETAPDSRWEPGNAQRSGPLAGFFSSRAWPFSTRTARPPSTMPTSTGTGQAGNADSHPRYVDRRLVLQYSLVLFARDAHFDALPQLTRV